MSRLKNRKVTLKTEEFFRKSATYIVSLSFSFVGGKSNFSEFFEFVSPDTYRTLIACTYYTGHVITTDCTSWAEQNVDLVEFSVMTDIPAKPEHNV